MRRADERRRGRALRSNLRLFRRQVAVNLSAGMEYRASFITQVIGMMLNNSAFILFWLILYERLGGTIKGYGFSDVMFLWALSATGYGVAAVFLGNASSLSRTISTGELDVYLLQPKPVLPSFLASRMGISGWGDMLYGVVLSFMLYPGSIFEGPVSILLHSFIPAALIAYIPAEMFRRFNAGTTALLIGADALIAAVAWAVFTLGLRRYESGNRFGARV